MPTRRCVHCHRRASPFPLFANLDPMQIANPEHTPLRPAYFKFLTLLAFHIFLKHNVRCAILEVGIGGRYDSTNIVPKPTVTGITTLGLDHTAILGNTLEEIAAQKAGIFKKGVPAASVWQDSQSARSVIEKEAQKVGVRKGGSFSLNVSFSN